MVATETAFEKKRVLAQGQINPEASSARKVKVSKTGIGGLGASAIFYKHLRESFRANRFGLWGTSSLIMVFGACLVSFFLRGKDGGTIILLAVIIIMLSGLVAAIVLGSMIKGTGVLIGLGVLAVWELLAALGCFALSKGVSRHPRQNIKIALRIIPRYASLSINSPCHGAIHHKVE